MDKQKLTNALIELGQDGKSRSETSRLREVFTEIESLMASGINRKAIVATLRENGFIMGLKSFESAVYRIRKRRRDDKATATGQVTSSFAVKPTLATSTSLEVTANSPSHLPVLVKPAIPTLNRGNMPMKQWLAVLRKETGKKLDEDDPIDEWDYEEEKGDKHDSSCD